MLHSTIIAANLNPIVKKAKILQSLEKAHHDWKASLAKPNAVPPAPVLLQIVFENLKDAFKNGVTLAEACRIVDFRDVAVCCAMPEFIKEQDAEIEKLRIKVGALEQQACDADDNKESAFTRDNRNYEHHEFNSKLTYFRANKTCFEFLALAVKIIDYKNEADKAKPKAQEARTIATIAKCIADKADTQAKKAQALYKADIAKADALIAHAKVETTKYNALEAEASNFEKIHNDYHRKMVESFNKYCDHYRKYMLKVAQDDNQLQLIRKHLPRSLTPNELISFMPIGTACKSQIKLLTDAYGEKQSQLDYVTVLNNWRIKTYSLAATPELESRQLAEQFNKPSLNLSYFEKVARADDSAYDMMLEVNYRICKIEKIIASMQQQADESNEAFYVRVNDQREVEYKKLENDFLKSFLNTVIVDTYPTITVAHYLNIYQMIRPLENKNELLHKLQIKACIELALKKKVVDDIILKKVVWHQDADKEKFLSHMQKIFVRNKMGASDTDTLINAVYPLLSASEKAAKIKLFNDQLMAMSIARNRFTAWMTAQPEGNASNTDAKAAATASTATQPNC